MLRLSSLIFSASDARALASGNNVVMKNMRPPLTDEEEEATPAGVLELMRQCWDKDENARPTFSEVSQITSGLVRSGSTKTTFVSDSNNTLV